MEKLVSVIIPIYNVERYLAQCVDSVLGQTYPALEVILVDDGSPDHCGEICDRYREADTRVRVIHKENGGLAQARNAGLAEATGKYVLFVDSDDWIARDMVEKLVRYGETENPDVIVFGYYRYYADRDTVQGKAAARQVQVFTTADEVKTHVLFPILGPDIGQTLPEGRGMGVWLYCYKHSIIRQYHLRFLQDKDYVSEDLHFNLACLHHARRAMVVPDLLYYYRFNTQSLSRAFRENKFALIKTSIGRAGSFLHANGLAEQAGFRLNRLFFMQMKGWFIMLQSSGLPVRGVLRAYRRDMADPFTARYLQGYPLGREGLAERLFIRLLQKKAALRMYGLLRAQRSLYRLLYRRDIR